MDSYNPSGLDEEEIRKLNSVEIGRYTGDPNDPNTPDTMPTQTSMAERQQEKEQEAQQKLEEEEKAKYDYKSQSGRFSAGTKADAQAMEVVGPLVTAAAGLPFIDLGMDVVGMLGGQAIDDAWDEKTRFSSPTSQMIRDVTGVIVPTVAGTAFAAPKVGSLAFRATKGSSVARGLAKVFTAAGVDMSVVAVSDYSERDEGIMNSLDWALDKMGNPLGMDIPNAVKVMDGDSPPVRRLKLIGEAGIFSLFGDALGYVLQRGKGPVEWLIPKDEIAQNYKISAALENPDPFSVKRTHEIDEELLLANQARLAKGLDKIEADALDARVSQLEAEKAEIIEEVQAVGISRVTDDPLESYVQKQDASRDWQTDEIGSRKLQADPSYSKYDPDIQAELADPSQTVRFSSPPGAVARNAADIAIMEEMPQKGVPNPVVTDPMLQDGLGVGEGSRAIIKEISEEKSQAGVYDAAFGAMRATYKEIEEAGWSTFTKILEADSVDELKSLFLTKRDVRELARGVTVSPISDPAAMEVGPALAALTQLHLTDDIAKTSARVMKTTGLEIETISEALNKFKGAVDPTRASQIIHDKMVFLFEEYGLNKSLAGWSLNNKKWWNPKNWGKKSPKQVFDEINELVAKNRTNAVNMHNRMKRLFEENPKAAVALAQAYDYTNGEVDTLVKMTKWANKQMSPTSLLFNADGKLNLFAKGLKQIRYNDVLSGLSAARAAYGNVTALILKPIEYMQGAALSALVDPKMTDLKAGWYAYSAFSAQGRALQDGLEMFKRAARDPDSVMDRVRTDYKFTDDEGWDVLDAVEDYEKTQGNTGKVAMVRWMRINRDLGKNPILRWGNNAMLGIDTYSNTLLATANSRFRAYHELISASDVPPTRFQLDVAAKKHYRNIFDSNGMIQDSWLKHTSGEVALNADTVAARAITQLTNTFPPLTPFMMFPNTGVNWIRKSLTYIPVANLLDGRTRKLYDALLSGNKEAKIFEALAEYGIDATKEPQYRMIYKNLLMEQAGRVAMGATLTMGLMRYALEGNIRGNLPVNRQDQRFWRDNKITPKQIKVLGKWVSYDGVPPFDPVLSMIGDMAYYANSVSPKFIENTRDQLIWTFAQTFETGNPASGLESLVQLIGGDQGAAISKHIANEIRSLIPLSGGQGVVANAISSTQKDIYNDFRGYLFNRLPIVNLTLPEQTDHWTGNKINDIQNPILRILNAASPVKISDDPEPWRQWLLSTGFNSTTMLSKDSTGSYDYTPEVRQKILQYMGENQTWREVEALRKDPQNQFFLDELRDTRYKELQMQMRGEITNKEGLKPNVGPIYTKLRKIVKQSQEKAEKRAIEEGIIPIDSLLGRQLSNKYLRYGNVDKAAKELLKLSENN